MGHGDIGVLKNQFFYHRMGMIFPANFY